ncbi:MAG TPA: YaaL family protein [Bacillaceae bacterium]
MFQRKKLRKEYDRKLIELMESTKEEWLDQKRLYEMSYEPDDDLQCRALMAKAKYFYLFREAKIRNVSLRK